MRVLLFGGTGMVGTEVLHYCLTLPSVTHICFVARREPARDDVPDDPRVHVRIVPDFADMRVLKNVVSTCDLCFFCIGVYTGMVPEPEFWKVTVEYFQELLDRLHECEANPVVCLFSAQGAKQDPGNRTPLFARAKGEAEKRLVASGITRRYIFRPGFIAPGRKAARSRIPVWAALPVYRLLPFIGIDAEDLARAMVETSIQGSDRIVFENSDIRALVKK